MSAPEVPVYFPSSLSELLTRFRAIDRLHCFLKGKKASSSCTVDDMRSFKDLFDAEAFDTLLKLCPGTIALDGGSTESSSVGFGSADDPELQHLMGTLTSQVRIVYVILSL